MQFRPLGSTGIHVSALALGAGPVPNLMTADDQKRQIEVVRRALTAGINWFDTAATYGNGSSERSLGQALHNLDAMDAIHIATKVRLMPEDLSSISQKIRESFTESLNRLGVSRVTLLQLHNSITSARGDEATSVIPADVLGSNGVLDEFRRLQDEGLVKHIGLTGIGQSAAIHEVVASGEFATIQVPYNVLNPSAGQSVPDSFDESNYGNIIGECARQNMGVLAIRVFAGGALAGQPPSAHTYTTKFFPLPLYVRDQGRCERLKAMLDKDSEVREVALRFVLSHPFVSSAIVGFGEPEHVDSAINYISAGPLPADLLGTLQRLQHLCG